MPLPGHSGVHGLTAPGFEPVRDAFLENFTHRHDLGAACTVYHRGEKVVDLWGGTRDRGRNLPWEENTVVLVFSTTKGMASIAMAVAHARGFLEWDEPIASYWPEFAANGKDRITVRQLMSHQAGLAVVREKLDARTLGDPDRLGTILARQRPAWKPGTNHGYHSVTQGWYQSEILRRVDPRGRRLGEFFRDEVARPLGLSFFIGLPPDVPESRIARIEGFHPARIP
ncbi:MAG: serine hydrolase domain-containing protein, partial [Acidobacteriota bacterium]|nr:serine hydrolase domain-containing protein [Acidobacteriota bacterium]